LLYFFFLGDRARVEDLNSPNYLVIS